MAAEYKIAGGVGKSRIFDQTPNVIRDAVIGAIRKNQDILGQIMMVTNYGFSRNVDNYVKYCQKWLPELVPSGSQFTETINDRYLIPTLKSYSTEMFAAEATRLQLRADEIEAIHSNTHPEYIAMMAKVDKALAISANPDPVIITVGTNIPNDEVLKGERYVQDHIGLYDRDNLDKYYTATTSIEPQAAFVDAILATDFTSNGAIPSIHYSEKRYYLDGSVVEDARFIALTLEEQELYISTWEATIVYVTFYDKAFNTNPISFFIHREDIPDFEEEIDVRGPNFPILPIGRDSIFTLHLDENSDSPIPVDKREYHVKHVTAALKLVNINLHDVTHALMDTGEIEELDDMYALPLSNLLTETQRGIRYNIYFFGTLRENAVYGTYDPAKDYYNPGLEQHDADYRLLESVRARTALAFYPVYQYKTWTHDDQYRSMLACDYIFSEKRRGVIGKRHFCTMKEKIYPEQFSSYVVYEYQFSDDEYLYMEVNNPVCSFYNFFHHHSGEYEIDESITLPNLVPSQNPETDSPYANSSMMSVPMSYEIAKGFPALAETHVYMENFCLYFYTVVPTKVEKWMIVVKVLVYIIMIIIIIASWGTLSPLLVLAITAFAVMAITDIIVAIVTAALGEFAGAVAGAVISVVAAVFTLGTALINLVKAVADIAMLVIKVLAAVVQLVTAVTKTTLLIIGNTYSNTLTDFASNILKLESDLEEEYKDLDGRDISLHPSYVFSPIDSSEMPSEYITRSLLVNPGQAVNDFAVSGFVAAALQLPKPQFHSEVDDINNF